jgi:serine/threonine protein kinase
MNYLHTLDPPVLHRNLKSQNLLVDEGGKVKIGDFGWSRLKTFDAGKTFFHGWQWVAPEILWGGKFTEAADVYSYSMVAWEVLTRSVPFHGLNPVQIGVAVREEKMRPPLPADCPPGVGELLEACWHDQPECRYQFTKILGRAQALVAMAE